MAELNPLAFQQAQNATLGSIGALQQNRLQQMAMQRAEDQYQQEQAANRLYAAAVGPDGTLDRTKLVTGFAQGGLGSKIPALQTQFATQDKATREAEKAKLEGTIQRISIQGQLLGSAVDQASYDAARRAAAQAGIDMNGVPEQFDATFVQQARQRTLTAAQQLEQEWKKRGFDQAESHFQQSQDTTRRGQDMSAATADAGRAVTMRGQDMQDARARETNAAKVPKEAQAEKTRVQDANDALGLIDMADKLLNNATGSRLGNAIDVGAGALGISTPGAQAGAQLKALEGALVSKMPKMSGPQSDKDVLLYRQMAAQIGDANLPIETRRAALNTVRQIQQKYAGSSAVSPTGGAQRVSDKAAYDALPSGSLFIAPDGTTRRKP